MASAVEQRINELKERIGAQGKWTILEDDKIDKAGCQITWDHGGMDWRPEQLMDAVMQTFGPHLPEISDELDVEDENVHNEEEITETPTAVSDAEPEIESAPEPEPDNEEPEHGG